jgi:hypothetical protein
MSEKQRVINFVENEWGTYAARFNRIPKEEGVRRVNEEGYETFQDMLAHIMEWWTEGMGIIMAIAEKREFERKKYDFDVFNAAAVAKYKNWNHAEFMSLFEETRLGVVADLKKVDEEVFANRRVQAWVSGIFTHHARVHLVACGKFIVLDTLENEYSKWLEKFDALEDKNKYLSEQGFERFEDMLAHTIGWWDEGVKVIEGIKKDANFVYDEPEVDSFNQKLIDQYKSMSSDEVRKVFEQKRIAMIDFVKNMDESLFENLTIERWLAADVVEHFDEHDM